MTHDEMAKELRSAGWSVNEPITQENCDHPIAGRMGTGSISSDGSSKYSWYCRRCGKSETYESPANSVKTNLMCWN